MRRKIFALILGAALCIVPASAIENPFSDVSSDSDLAQPVMWALENGVTSGTSDTTFAPDSTCTRGQVVTFLWNENGQPAPTSTENPFTDVAESAWYYDAVLWAVEQKITAGTSDTTFDPSETCTSAQVITFLWNANQQPEAESESALAAGYGDVWYANSVAWADTTGLLEEMGFAPNSVSPRSDIVTYLWRNAGAPAVEVTDPEAEPEVISYSYTMPQVEKPGTATMSQDYFNQVLLYMMVNDLESYNCTFDVGSGYTLEDQGLYGLIGTAFTYIKDRYIELGGFYPGIQMGWSSNGKTTTVTLTLTNNTSSNSQIATEKATFLAQVETLVANFFAQGALSESDSDYTKALHFYRWCALNLQYDLNFRDGSYNGYGTLNNYTGVCQGYVSIFNAMCNCAGIQAYGVSGTTDGEGHIWSYLNLDGTWCYADPTFGDPIPNQEDYCNESYFAVSKQFLDSTHVMDAIFES